jgi:cytochrome c biogenesis protein CcmG/thiol:disulfide interchange protein DsbE
MRFIKKIIAGICFIFWVSFVHAQPSLPAAMLKNVRGAMVSFSSVTKKDSLILVCFWATTSEQSMNELNAISAQYEKWKQNTKFKLMAVSVDEGKAANRLKPIANMNGWAFDVYGDTNSELRNALNAKNLPEAMIIKGGKVVYQQSGYEPGSENYLIQKIREFAR